MSTELVEIVVDGQEAPCLLQSDSKSSAAWAILRVSIMKGRLSGVSAPGSDYSMSPRYRTRSAS